MEYNFEELSYSFHLGNDKNKRNKAKKAAEKNVSGTTSFNHNAIQNVRDLGKVNNHNLRKYDNNQELIEIIRGSNDIIADVKEKYKEEFEDARKKYNQKQTRDDRKINDYFNKISNDDKHDLACEIIIELGNMEFWKDKPMIEKYKMVLVFEEQIIDLEKTVPQFKIVNAVVHFDESSPHLHIVGLPVKENCKTGMEKQIGKTTIFTRESLRIIQDEMRKACIKSFNKMYNLEANLKPKEKGRNNDIPSNQMEEHNQKKRELQNEIDNLKNEVNNLENTKKDVSQDIDNLNSEKENINDEIKEKKKKNRQIIIKDKAALLEENHKLKDELQEEKRRYRLLEFQYNSLKEKTDYLVEQAKKAIDKIPSFIREILERLFIYNNISLEFFKQRHDPEVIEQAKKEQERRRRLFAPKQPTIDFYEEDLELSKEKDDFDLSR